MMKINPDDLWYPYTPSGHGPTSTRGVTIRLKLAAMAMQGMLTGNSPTPIPELVCDAFKIADAMIERANRDA